MIRFSALDSWEDPRGGQIERIRIDNGILALEVLSLGGIIRSLWAPDRHGERTNIVLGCDSAADYLAQDACLGAAVGRYANRIKQGQINCRGKAFSLDKNFNGHCLHGGREGFHRRLWQLGTLPDGVRLSLISPDGDMGFPGECRVQLDYRLAGNNLFVEFMASSSQDCPVSLTQHSYFNLDGRADIAEHQLQLDSNKALATDSEGIPCGIVDTQGSMLDLSQGKVLKTLLGQPELAAGQGLDHCFISRQQKDELWRVGRLSAPLSGRGLTLYTNQPGVQLYTGAGLEDVKGRKGQAMKAWQGVCLEPQMLPDGANQPQLHGDPWITPGQVYHHLSRYEFDTQA
ncbi:aldose epimerase family protein [Shewanella algae]|uniref:aldose epimerase family protein n=1 Tax=Shewanella algae TaxID=38313 RepID=UPI0031F4E838